MSPTVSPTNGPAAIESVTPSAPGTGPVRASRTQAAQAPVSLQAIPASPPAEVLDEMARAADVYDRLGAQGRTLSFAYDPASRRAAVDVHDRKGNLVGQLSLAQALDVAAGAPLE